MGMGGCFAKVFYTYPVIFFEGGMGFTENTSSERYWESGLAFSCENNGRDSNDTPGSIYFYIHIHYYLLLTTNSAKYIYESIFFRCWQNWILYKRVFFFCVVFTCVFFSLWGCIKSSIWRRSFLGYLLFANKYIRMVLSGRCRDDFFLEGIIGLNTLQLLWQYFFFLFDICVTLFQRNKWVVVRTQLNFPTNY